MSDALDLVARSKKLDAARDLIRSAGVRTEEELAELIGNLVSSIDAKYATPTMEMTKAQLTDSACWLEGPRDEFEPELPEQYSGKERGQFDQFTQGVLNRG